MGKKDWRWVLGWSLVALLLANLPYLLGWAISTPQSHFGGFYFIVEDGNSYLAKMRDAALDGWRFYLPYSHEPQSGGFGILFLYTLLGKLLHLVTNGARIGGLLVVYHSTRVLGGLLLLLVVYRFIAHFVEGTMRRLAFLLAVFASGLGWLIALLGWYGTGNVPLEFWAPDAFLFPILSGPPHIILAVPMLLAAMLATLRAWRTYRWKPALAAAALTLALTLVRPSYFLIYGAVMAIAWCVGSWRRRRTSWLRAGQLAPALILPLPLVFSIYQALYYEPVLQQWTMQNPFASSPMPWQYLAGYGLLLVPALWSLRQGEWWRRNDRWLLLLWLALVPLMAYAPFQAQRRLIGGAEAPLAIAAARGLWCEGRRRNWLGWTWLLLTLPTTLFLVVGGNMMVASRPPTLFHSPDELAALHWLSDHTTADDVILGAIESGNLIPVYADARVLLGHPLETIQFTQKEAAVQAFFDPATSSDARWDILDRYGITLIFDGPWEQALGQFDPQQMSGLRPVYAGGRYQVLQVTTIR
jgi:hypothetical protein